MEEKEQVPEEVTEEATEEKQEEIVEEKKEEKKEELEFNRQHREEFEQLMEESSTNLDGYWDKNNWFVRILLLGLLVVIVVGCIAVFGAYFASR